MSEIYSQIEIESNRDIQNNNKQGGGGGGRRRARMMMMPINNINRK
jgi:hypothetical protein